MRPFCIECAIKHISKAIILLQESEYVNIELNPELSFDEILDECGPERNNDKPYAAHRYLAIGHMSEAADELMEEFPITSNAIRQCWKLMESNEAYVPPLMEILNNLLTLS
ncbi:MAG: hypothetical protein GF411_14375 [Candidatus Lokiarchaeota archaeon]|nr:hypothetical protein [Candidatus Lokiarchaeota archaeon]